MGKGDALNSRAWANNITRKSAAAAKKRPTSVVFLAPKKGDADFAKEAKFVEVVAKVKAAQAALADAAP